MWKILRSPKKSSRTNKWDQNGSRILNQCRKSIVFPHSSYEPTKNEVQKIAPFMIASKRITYSGEIQQKEWKVYICILKITKYCWENVKIFKAGGSIPCPWIRQLSPVRKAYLLKSTWRAAGPIKSQLTVDAEMDTWSWILCGNAKDPEQPKQSGKTSMPAFQNLV